MITSRSGGSRPAAAVGNGALCVNVADRITLLATAGLPTGYIARYGYCLLRCLLQMWNFAASRHLLFFKT